MINEKMKKAAQGVEQIIKDGGSVELINAISGTLVAAGVTGTWKAIDRYIEHRIESDKVIEGLLADIVELKKNEHS